jgi:ABC-type Fe3+/spermidine/putrescine transport system ATPase subunit
LVGEIVIQIEHLEKTFEGRSGRSSTAALQDISFSVADGEICCLLGPSGCGKSTILNILAGFEQASGGAYFLAGALAFLCDLRFGFLAFLWLASAVMAQPDT